MCVLREMRGLIGMMLLGPGMVVANGTEPVAPNMPPPSQAMPAMAAPIWPHMMPVPGAQPYYLAPQPGMTWPMLPQYPGFMIMPHAMPTTWPSFVWVWVPVQAMASVPAAIDYSPVADTPANDLPLDDVAATPTAFEGAIVSPMAAEADKPVTAGTEAPLELQSATGMGSPLSATSESVAVPVAASVSAIAVDYGPVTPTPVVDMLALEKQLARASLRKPSRPSSRQVAKPAMATSNKTDSTTESKPAKKRMCWTNGVVAPCR